MTELTDRYIAAALRGIPDAERSDVERELQSSIADAVEDRVAGGEERSAAERAVLEGLGDPMRLSAGMTGKPLYLIGPDLFVAYRQLLVMLLSIVLPIVALVQVGVGLVDGDDIVGALLAGVGGAWTVGVHLAFWVTLIFAVMERVDAMREARDEISSAVGQWSVDRLPELPRNRITASETVGEVVMTMLMVLGLVFLSGVEWFTDAAGNVIALFNPDLWSGWMPALIAILVGLALLRVVVFLVGRWTMPLVAAFAVLEIAFAIPVIYLALNGLLINPAFADAIGWPPLAEGDGPAMIALALGLGAVTVWEIVEAFRRARRSEPRSVSLGAPGEAAR